MADEAHIDAKFRTLEYSIAQFDKNVLFIASGALGISFAFIEKIVPNLIHAENKHFLINSWYCFAGVIFISLVAHFISILAIRWAIIHDDLEKIKYKKITGWWNWCVRTLNILMILGLFLGVILLVLFVKQNI